MTAISASQVKELRERTGLGMMECKKALVESNGSIEEAIENLRKNSGMKAAKKAGRTSAEGVVTVKASDDATYAQILEVNSETDFVARDSNFLEFVDQVAGVAFEARQTDVAALMDGALEEKRQGLVQKIGENISVRRVAEAQGDVVGSYVHSNSKIAVLVALSGGNEDLAKDIAMHVAAVNPQFIAKEDVSEDVIQKEREIYTAQAEQSGKPAEIIAKMVEGRISKFLAEISLTEQAFVKDPDQKVGKLLSQANAKVVNMIRFEVGEGIEREEVDFAAEVAAQLKG